MRHSLFVFLTLWMIINTQVQSANLLPMNYATAHRLSLYISNPSNLALSESYGNHNILYGVQLDARASLFTPNNTDQFITDLSEIINSETINQNSVNDFERVVNRYFINNDYQIKATGFSNIQLLLPYKNNSWQIGIQSDVSLSQTILAQNGFDVGTAVNDLIDAALSGTTLSSTAFLNAVDSDVGFVNSLVKTSAFYVAYNRHWKVRRQMRFAGSIKLKFSHYSLSENIVPARQLIEDQINENDTFNLSSFRDTLGSHPRSKEHYSPNMDLGAAIYTPNVYWGLSIVDIFPQRFTFIHPNQTCESLKQCQFIQTHFANREREIRIEPKARGEFSYLFGHRIYLSTQFDINPWKDNDDKENQYIAITIGRNSALYNNQRLLGFANPNLNLSYISNLTRQENYIDLGISVWHFHLNVAFSPNFFTENTTNLDNNVQQRHFFTGLRFSNSY